MDVAEFGVQLIWSKAGNDLHQHRWKVTVCGENLKHNGGVLLEFLIMFDVLKY